VTDAGENHDSIAAFVGVDSSLITRALNNDRPSMWAGAVLVLSMPEPVQRLIAATWFRHLGGIAVMPDVDRETASSHLLSSVVFILASLSASTRSMEDIVRSLSNAFTGRKRMAKAVLPVKVKKEIA
jgi:hypothetical protein